LNISVSHNVVFVFPFGLEKKFAPGGEIFSVLWIIYVGKTKKFPQRPSGKLVVGGLSLFYRL